MPKKQIDKDNKLTRNLIILTIFFLFLIVVLTKYYGSADVGDYADTAKFFAGKYNAKLRSSHSILYGLIHSPFVKLTGSFIFLKISSVLWLSLLILSMYYISKNKKTLLLFITTPIIWYMAPWISPIQLASLFFLWGYYFINKYNKDGNIKNLLYSGLLIGLSWAFWDAIIYFAIILAICFLYNKKTSHFFYFILFLFIGTSPKLIVDQLLFGFAFYSIAKHFFAEIAFTFYEGIYGQRLSSGLLNTIFTLLFTLLFIPFFSFLFYKKNNFVKYKKTIIFLTLSAIFILTIHIRYTLFLVPIIILLLGEILNDKQFKIQIIIFLFLTLLVINPYLLQIKYETNGKEFEPFLMNLPNLQINSTSYDSIIQQDLSEIATNYPNQKFIVGNKSDDYQHLAHIYWGSEIKEFISIQDYELFLKNETTITGKTLCSESKFWNRRDICITISLEKTLNDTTDYNSIKYAISVGEPIKLANFEVVKKYNVLYLSKKIKNTGG